MARDINSSDNPTKPRSWVDRRVLLGAGVASVATAGVAAWRAAAPAIIGGEITPERYGAGNRDAAKDTLAWNRAVAEASRTRRPVVAKGTYVLRVPAQSSGNWVRRPSAPMQVAVQLASNVQINGAGATILVGAPEKPPIGKDERHFLFGSGEHLEPGALSNIGFDGLTFDFREEYGDVHRFTYAVAAIGVDHLTRRNLKIVSTGALNGRGLLSQNVRYRDDRDIDHQNITQGIFTHYERDVFMQRISFDKFNEAMDYDGPCWNVRMDQLRFANSYGDDQCIDTAAGSDWLVTNVTAINTGPIAYVYIKANGWPTYRQWVESDHAYTPNYVIPERMTFRGIHGRNTGLRNGKGEVIRVGSYRSAHMLAKQGAFTRSPRDITLEDWTIDGGTQIAVNDCENIQMHHIRMSNIWTPAGGEDGAAIVLREPPPSLGGHVTGSVSDVTIVNSGGMGVSAVAGPALSIADVTVQGFNTEKQPATDSGIRIKPRAGTARGPTLGAMQVTDGTGRKRAVDMLAGG